MKALVQIAADLAAFLFVVATFAWLVCEFLTGIDPFYG